MATEVSAMDLEGFAKLSRAASFSCFQAINRTLGLDTQRCLTECLRVKGEFLEGELSQAGYAELGFWYRGLARALLSYIEDLLYVMRQLTVFAYDRGEVSLSLGEFCLLRECSFIFDSRKKRVVEKGNFNRFLKNFILSFRYFPQIFGSEFKVDLSVHGWESLQALVKMRNALTHPKSVEDTLLSPEMPDVIKDAASWFMGCMSEMVASFDPEVLKKSLAETAEMPQVLEMLGRRGSSS